MQLLVSGKQSFLSNLLGESTYEDFYCYARYIVGAGSFILIVLFILSFLFHSGIILELLKIAIFSPLCIVYVVACILLLDIRVNVEKTEQKRSEIPQKKPKLFKYKLTIVWPIILLILGIMLYHNGLRYTMKYEFECTTFLVDHGARIYHLDWDGACEKVGGVKGLELMYGYEIDDTYSYCEECKAVEREISKEWIHR